MGKPSKEEAVLELFFDEPTKHWHFKEIREKINLPDNKISKWLKKFIKKGLIKRVKERNKRPYYLAEYDSSEYFNSKRIFALNKLYESGLLTYLTSLKEAKNITLFGSFSRGDWYKESDIDLFIYGDIKSLVLGRYQTRLHREFQLFISRDEAELKKLGPALSRSIIKGINIKGEIPLEMIKNAYFTESRRSL